MVGMPSLVGLNVLGSAGVEVVIVGILHLHVSWGEGGQWCQWSWNKSSRLSYSGLMKVSDTVCEMALRGVGCHIG